MALKKPTFEKEPTDNDAAVTAVMDPPTEATVYKGTAVGKSEPAAPQAVDPVVAQEAATTAIAKASGTALTTNQLAEAAKRFKKEFEDMRGAADFSFGTHRVFKADNGEIKELSGEKESLGRWVKVQLLAWDFSYQVSPSDQSESSGGFVAYSMDGKTIDSGGDEVKGWEGKSVQDYIEHLRDEGFKDAKLRQFLDTEVAILGCEADPEFRGVVQITLSPTSVTAFNSYQADLMGKAKCVQMGLPGYSLPENPFQFFLVREGAEDKKKNRTWTKFKICSNLPAKI